MRWMVWPFHGRRTFWALMVMPRSRSRSMESRYCSRMSRASTAPVSSRMRSESVVLPWSMWLMIDRLRMEWREIMGVRPLSYSPGPEPGVSRPLSGGRRRLGGWPYPGGGLWRSWARPAAIWSSMSAMRSGSTSIGACPPGRSMGATPNRLRATRRDHSGLTTRSPAHRT